MSTTFFALYKRNFTSEMKKVARSLLGILVFAAVLPMPASLIADEVFATALNQQNTVEIRQIPPQKSNGIDSPIGEITEKLATDTDQMIAASGQTKSPAQVNHQPSRENATSITAPAPSPADSVAAGVPYFISIPSIGLNSQIVGVGLTTGGNVDVPGSVVGWWNGSASAGSPGAMFLDGHSPGVLGGLASVPVGGQIFIQAGGGITATYTVASVEVTTLESVNMRRALSPISGGAGLNIMTCTGQYDAGRGTYSHRLIVYAVKS